MKPALHRPARRSGVLSAASTTLLILLVSATALAQKDEKKSGFFGLGWLDQTQAYSSDRADALASQVDRFFGVERSDLEAAYSSLRLITEARWQQHESLEPHIRLRGRLYLPRVNERVSLIFSEDQGEGTSYYREDTIFSDPQSTRVNVEVNLRERDKYRFDFRVGMRSSLKLRTSVRYRYEDNLTEKMHNRLSETVYFIDGIGFGSFTQYQVDRSLSPENLVRWSTEFRTEEKLEGNEWASSLAWFSRYTDHSGISYFVRMASNTGFDYISQYQTGIRLRRNIARPWLFVEFAPGYQWEKSDSFAPREGSLFAVLRLEMAIGKL